MNMRQVLEAGSAAAFAIVHPDHEHFVKKDKDGTLVPSKQLAKKRYDCCSSSRKLGHHQGHEGDH